MHKVIYHADCADGFASAWVARKFLPDAEFIACQYQGLLPTINKGDIVHIVDFSFPRDALLEMSKIEDVEITVLDHHKSAQADLEGESWRGNIFVLFDMHKCGARLTWEHFFPNNELPELIRYIEDRDLWQWQLPNSKEVSAAIRSYPFDFAVWDSFVVPELAIEGKAILRYTEQQLQDLIGRALTRRCIGGYSVPVINAPYSWASEICHILNVNEPFAASYEERGSEIIWSLRSSPDGVDVSEIAKQFGGGGHKHAAGFKEQKS